MQAVAADPPDLVILDLGAHHRTIRQEVWGPEYGHETHYLRVYASQLRKKLQDRPDRPRLVTEPGVGYRLNDETLSLIHI